MFRLIRTRKAAGLTVILTVAVVNCALAQDGTLLDDGTTVTATLIRPWSMGPPQSELGASAVGLPFFTLGLTSLGGKGLPITFVGGNPLLGSGTTSIPTVIVPLNVVFQDGSGTLDASPLISNILQSPVFNPTQFSAGSTDLGVTQYGDAVQRAQFWILTNPAGVSPNYHVLLTPTVLPAITINVPVGIGHIVHTAVGNIPLGIVDDSFWEPVIFNLLRTIGASADQMPVFVAMNIGLYLGTPSNCCILGYHNSTSGSATTAQTWIFASWLSSGIFSTFQDVVGLSHEVSEWLNDPFVGAMFFNQVPGVNWTPPYVLPGQGGLCQANFETGDAVEALTNGAFPVNTNGFTYHLQDSVFVWWFLHTSPSPAVNGRYTLQGIFSTPSTLCGPG